MKRWTQIFKAFGNINRLKIVKLLKGNRPLSVTDIAAKLGISLNAVSKHLILLHNLDVLENKGQQGHVFYSLNPDMPKDLQRAVALFL